MLAGRVVDARGVALADAAVSNGQEVVRTDGSGLFYLHVERADAWGRLPAKLLARSEGRRAARYTPPEAPDGGLEWPEHVELILEREPLTVAGRVLDAGGRPLRCAEVWIADPTVFVTSDEPGESSIEMSPISTDPVTVIAPDLIEYGDRSGVWNPICTDDEGNFEIAGLFERNYIIEAMDPSSLVRSRVEARAGARGIELVLDIRSGVRSLEGRIVDRFGEPIAGVRVVPRVTLIGIESRGCSLYTQQKSGTHQITGPDGSFWFDEVPMDAYLHLEGPSVWVTDFGGSEPERTRLFAPGLEITVVRQVRLSVELARSLDADSFRILGPGGEPLRLSSQRGRSRVTSFLGKLVGGRSEPYFLSDAAERIVFLQGETILAEEALLLQAGLNVVR